LYEFICEGGVFDFHKYFIISISSLGTPGSCSPSTTGLRYRFPKYSFKDKVNFKRQFLKEKFNIDHVKGFFGTGMGGYEVYMWACEYPDEMDFIILMNSSYKTSGYRYAVARGIESIIEATDDFYKDVYNDSLSRTMVSINKMLYSNYFSKRSFQKMTNDEIDVLMDDHAEEKLFMDIYDFKLQNDSILNYDLEDKLSNIKAKTLVIAPKDDLYFSKEFDILPLKDLIADCEIQIFDLSDEYYEGNIDFAEFSNILYGFLKNFD